MHHKKLTLALIVLSLVLDVRQVFAAERNAPEIYRQALSAVPIDKETVEQLKKYDEISIEEGRKIVTANAATLKLLMEGSEVAQCDWKIAATGDPDLSFLSNMWGLLFLSDLQARVSASDGKVADAMKTLRGAIILARRVQQIPFPITRLLGEGTQGSALNNAAIYLPQADKDSIEALLAAVDAPVKLPSIDEVMSAVFQTSDYRAKPPTAEERIKIKNALQNMENTTRAYTEIFRAACAWRLKGEDAMKKIADPFGDGPFAVKKWEGGFELTSKLTIRGNPVSLTIGKEQGK